MTQIQKLLMGVLYVTWLVLVAIVLIWGQLTTPVQIAIGVGGLWIIASILLTGWSEK